MFFYALFFLLELVFFVGFFSKANFGLFRVIVSSMISIYYLEYIKKSFIRLFIIINSIYIYYNNASYLFFYF